MESESNKGGGLVGVNAARPSGSWDPAPPTRKQGMEPHPPRVHVR